jgi:beta-glucosidase
MKNNLHFMKVLLLVTLAFTLQLNAQYKYAFQNPDLPIEQRIDSIISLMTLDEKVAVLSTDPSVPRLGIKGSKHVEGLHGLSMGKIGGWGGKEPIPTTIFPQSIGLAETWDTAMLRMVGEIEGYDVRFLYQRYSRGGLVVRAPNADIGRDIRWGRNEECYGEDAWFNGSMVASFIKGLQGNNPKYLQAASLMKHFLANSNENSRESSSSDFNERLWREYYSLSFRKGVEAGARCYMAAYNKYNGIPCTVNPMLKNITMKEWGVDGIVCTDGGAYRLLVKGHKHYPDLNLAAGAVIKSGINQFLDNYREGVYAALANKYVTEKDIDTVIRGNFRMMIRLGLLDPPSMVPYSQIGVKDSINPCTTQKNKDAVRLVTQKSIVLLKNEGNILPINKNKVKKIVVIGNRAADVLQDWYSGDAPYAITPLDGIKSKAGKDIEVLFQKNNNSDSAANLAKQCDVAIIIVGNHPTGDAGWALCPVPSDGKEAVDRLSINLEQEDMIRQVYRANKNTIVVLISSFPFAINWTKQNVPSILHMTHCSQELGNALADVIFGDYNPAGRLVQTWPQNADQLPEMMDYNIRNGRTYMYFKDKPLFAFGFGLSYTTFEYSNLQTKMDKNGDSGKITVKVDIKNTGNKDGEEVPQVYVSHINSKVERPISELKGFSRVSIKAGQTKTVEISVNVADLAYWNVEQHKFVVENDDIMLKVGSSSDNIKLTKKVSLSK